MATSKVKFTYSLRNVAADPKTFGLISPHYQLYLFPSAATAQRMLTSSKRVIRCEEHNNLWPIEVESAILWHGSEATAVYIQNSLLRSSLPFHKQLWSDAAV